MGEETHEPTQVPSKLQEQLDAAELRLRKIQRWAAVIAITSGIITLLNAYSAIKLTQAQGNLAAAQVFEQQQKRRVSLRFKVTPVLLPDARHFYLKASLKNYSVRELNILMVHFQVWKGNGWSDENDFVSEHLQDILISDILVKDCPPELCPEQEQGRATKPSDASQLLLRELEPSGISIESTEPELELTYGPYSIDPQKVHGGIWVEGLAYVHETEQGTCELDLSTVPDNGDEPDVCEKTDNGKCGDPQNCLAGHSPAQYYQVKMNPRDKTLSLHLLTPQ